MEFNQALTLVENAIKEHENKEPGSYSLDATLKELKIDSMDIVEITMLIEVHLNGKEITNVHLNEIKTVRDIVLLLEHRF
jgi:acyl carrier protein